MGSLIFGFFRSSLLAGSVVGFFFISYLHNYIHLVKPVSLRVHLIVT